MAKRYSQGFKDRAVRILVDRLAGDGSCSQWQAVREIAPKLEVANESLRRWYEQYLVVTSERQGSRVKSVRKSNGLSVRLPSCAGRMRI